MCGIAAFSLSQNSKQNARELAHHLLTEIENRGSHASGFAYVTQDGNVGLYKNPKPGSQLPLHELPRNAKTVILHTRFATQGSPQDNRNNHPVVSPDNRIALVHNGVISNDGDLRESLGLTARHGEVDSLVIPALLAQEGIDGLKKLSGYAAIAWIDGRERGDLHIAKLKNSPVNYTWLFDGSFVMASTEAILTDALDSMKAFYGGVFALGEGRMINVVDGFIMEHEAAPAMTYSHRAWSQYSGATAGGHDARTSTTPSTPQTSRSSYLQPTGPAQKIGAVGSEVTKPQVTTDPTVAAAVKADSAERSDSGAPLTQTAYYEDLEEWRKKADARDAEIAKKAVERATGANVGEMDGATPMPKPDSVDWDSDWEAYFEQMEQRDRENAKASSDSCSLAGRYIAGEGYYIVDNDGDMTHYPTLDDLESKLAWFAKMGRTEYDLWSVEDELHWINGIQDLGSVDEAGRLESWVEDTADVDNHESPAVRNLQYIREGAQKLASVKGA